MSFNVRHRLTGALVLISLMVIVVPMFLSGHLIYEKPIRIDVPPRPTHLVPPPNKGKEPIEHTGKPITHTPLKGAWVIQLGTFKQKDNVASLLARLRSQGYTSFMRTLDTQSGAMYRVYVGPDLDKEQLVKIREKLKQEERLSGFIVQYKIKEESEH